MLLLGAVGQLQFEVVAHRLEHEYGVKARIQPSRFQVARWVTCDDANELKRFIDGNSHRVAHDAVDAPTVLVEYAPELRAIESNWPKVGSTRCASTPGWCSRRRGLKARVRASARRLIECAAMGSSGTIVHASRHASRLSLYQPHPLDRPAGTYLLLWPTLSALWIAAGGFAGWHLLTVFVLGTFLMRSAGCAVNDVADRDFDKHVERTAQRPVTSGAVEPKEALLLGAVLALLAFALVLTTNTATIAWSFAALAVTSSIRSPSASSRCHRRCWAWPSASASRWPLRRRRVRCRRSRGGCSWATSSGCLPTTPSTRWSTATTTSRSASTRRRSRSGAWTWPA
jgi:hypothetical protein